MTHWTSVVLVVGLIGAGFVYGYVPRRRVAPGSESSGSRKGKWFGIAIVAIVALPVSILMLAKLFDSAVLGWIFGLSLMAGAALFAGAVLFVIGLVLGAILRKDAPAKAELSRPISAMSESIVQVKVDRDTVHASDDGDPFPIVVAIEPGRTLADLLARIDLARSLPTISGGLATWTVESPGRAATLAVLAQQWTEPRWLVSPNAQVGVYFAGTSAALRLKYRSQVDPDDVYAQLGACASRDSDR